MAESAPADPDLFPEASKWFRGRVAVTRAEWDGMTVEARRQAFTIAGTQQLEVVQTVMSSLQSAIDKGTPIDEWRASIKDKLGKQFAGENATNLTTAFINANQTAYHTGRWYQMADPAVTAALPWRRFDSLMDGHETQFCHDCHGTIVRYDDPWLLTHWCPCHHKCRSTIRALSDRMAKRAGGATIDKPRPAPASGDFGLAPPLRATWEPDLTKYDSHLSREYLKKQGRMKAANGNAQPRPERLKPKRK